MAEGSDTRAHNYDPVGFMLMLIILFVAGYFLCLFLWNRYESLVKDAFLFTAYHLRYVQLIFYPLLTDLYGGVLSNLPNLYHELMGTNYETVYLQVFMTIALRNIAIIMALITIPFGIILIRNHQKISFTRQLNVDDIIEIQRKYYPRIKPATNRNLLKVDARFYNWASALNPIEFMVHSKNISLVNIDLITSESRKYDIQNRLNDLKHAELRNPIEYTSTCTPMCTKEYGIFNWPTSIVQAKNESLTTLLDNIDSYHGLLTFDKDKAKDLFSESLGPRCKYRKGFIDIRYLPPAERAMWVIFLACISQTKKLRTTIEDLLDQLSSSFTEGEYNSHNDSLDLAGIDKLMDEAVKIKKVVNEFRRISRCHAYYYTAFYALYASAKDSYGTIKTTDFHWLRVVNRTLFYALDSYGMDRSRIESAGIRSHYLAEKKMNWGQGGRISNPQVESAVIGLFSELEKDQWAAIDITEEVEDEYSPIFMRPIWKELTN